MGEAKVKSYTRKTKSGKTVQVRAHSRKCEGGSCTNKKGAGVEYSDKAKSYYRKGYLAQASKHGVDENTLNLMREHSDSVLSARLSDRNRDYKSARNKQKKFYSGLSEKQKKFYKKYHNYSEE